MQGLPAYPAQNDRPERVDVPTGTVWIWLNVLLPLVTLPTLLLLDTGGYLRATFEATATEDRSALLSASASYTAAMLYVIGRGVVLRRRTGRGLGPVWGWIAVTAVSLIVGAVYATLILTETFDLLRTYSASLSR